MCKNETFAPAWCNCIREKDVTQKPLFIWDRMYKWDGACADPEGGKGGPDPPPQDNYKKKYRVTILVRIPLKSKSYQSSIQCWAYISLPGNSI